MTQSVSTNPWEAAQAQAAQQYQTPAQHQQSGQGIAEAYTPEPPKSRLFGQEQSAPSLFNKTHFLGTVREGIITGPPRTVQDKDFDSRKLKYFSKSKVGIPVPAITTDPIDAPTGERNDPVMSEHFDLQTEYRMTEAECYAVDRPVSFVKEDDGTRVEVIGGRDLKAFRKAMKDFIAAGGKLTCPEDFVGLKLASKRAGQVPAGANKAWVREFILSRP